MSQKPVAEKLYIKSGMRIGILNAPGNVTDLVTGLPENVEIINNLEDKTLPLILAFVDNRNMLENYLGELKNSIAKDGALWIAYCKKSSQKHTDLDRDYIHEQVQIKNMKGVAMISIDEDWSAFRCRKKINYA